MTRQSVAMTGSVEGTLRDHLLRGDGQEDLCLAIWHPSTGVHRQSALLVDVVIPDTGDREVHGNAHFAASFVLRAARNAAQGDAGVALLHSHPGGSGWQQLSLLDRRAEASIANFAREITGLPLVGMTLAGDGSWSARVWNSGRGPAVTYSECESVRVIGDTLRMTYNDQLRPPPRAQRSQHRTVHAWGSGLQADLARLRVLVVGGGSVGLHVVEVLARTGIEHIAVMDFDRVEWINLDRLHAARRLDAAMRLPKVDLARRILKEGATARMPRHELLEMSVCEPAGMRAALDFDVVFACTDRPWPRHVLNTIAYADLIPVIDTGIHVDPLPGGGLRDATWRSLVATVDRTCMACARQYDPAHVQLERDGSLDDAIYIAGLPAGSALRARENVAAFSIAAASASLNQFLALAVAPSGLGDPGALRHSLALHRVVRESETCSSGCPYQASAGDGDRRVDPSGPHLAADRTRASDSRRIRWLRSGLSAVESALTTVADAAVLGRESRLE